ncbi:MAG: regulator of sirC expression with transglutaminase-like and TPR domain [Paraglaciecola sp.]|jgi:regulator of sirC expression with transglutaminase-like and TPR domain
MKTLKEAIECGDLLSGGLLVSTLTNPRAGGSLADYQAKFAQWCTEARLSADVFQVNDGAFTRFIHYFYRQLAFSGDAQHDFSCKHSLIDSVMDYRTGMPVSLAIIFVAIAGKLGFDVQGVNFPGHFLLRYLGEDQRAKYLDPKSGNWLSESDLSYLYFSVLSEIDNETMPEEALYAASSEEILVHLLHNIKAAYIHERKYEQALMTVELLIDLCPNNPYERRDRGILLHELHCPQLAIADYQYFIRQCPKDPAATLLEMQVRNMEVNSPVMH